jgi:arylsulfatase
MDTPSKPNIVLILNDDMGYSDLGCYGGEIDTPNLDGLAANGLRFSQFYNTARCSPSRASLLTGLHPHQTGVGILTYDSGPEGYAGNLNHRCVTIPQALKKSGYKSYMSGKWHVASSLTKPTDTWPLQRGFDEFFGTIIGAGSFYDPNTLTRGNTNIEHEAKADPGFFYTDAISDQAVAFIEEHHRASPSTPSFTYVAYTAPHWPLHAHDEDIAKYKGRFDQGWDALRAKRLDQLVAAGILDARWKLTDRDPTQPPWTQAEHKAWLLRCMEVYAAQVDRMDQGIGRILDALRRTGQLDNTLVIFLADNGACAEDIPEDVTVAELVDKLMIAKSHTRSGEPVHFGNDTGRMPGPENTYQSYGTAWANLSNRNIAKRCIFWLIFFGRHIPTAFTNGKFDIHFRRRIQCADKQTGVHYLERLSAFTDHAGCELRPVFNR